MDILLLQEVMEQGACNVLADFSEDEEHPNIFWSFDPPEGFYVASQGNRLIAVQEDGSFEVLTSWSSDPADEEFNLDGRTIAVDLVTLEIAILDGMVDLLLGLKKVVCSAQKGRCRSI